MLVCIIEFGTAPGKEEENRALVAELMIEAKKNDGFISKEGFTSRDNPGKIVTLSYWKSAESLRDWMLNAEHRKGIVLGKKELLSHYTIQIAEISSERSWTKPEGKISQ